MRYRVPPADRFAANERARLTGLGDPRDLAGGTMRLALHLSIQEHDELVRLNPDTLGAPDQKLADLYWYDFCSSPESAPFRVHSRV